MLDQSVPIEIDGLLKTTSAIGSSYDFPLQALQQLILNERERLKDFFQFLESYFGFVAVTTAEVFYGEDASNLRLFLLSLASHVAFIVQLGFLQVSKVIMLHADLLISFEFLESVTQFPSQE